MLNDKNIVSLFKKNSILSNEKVNTKYNKNDGSAYRIYQVIF
jgi:hypothetical protein